MKAHKHLIDLGLGCPFGVLEVGGDGSSPRCITLSSDRPEKITMRVSDLLEIAKQAEQYLADTTMEVK